ncbi:hypothetical protein [Dyella amyloliquefaciens]|uniref:hypothetical protein n=1 Tax=Dyella amyloliquefaciens TaxID=1770545 RepID=UPI00102E2FD7|nr:hypothetical protein [Dyella amyloliquefaciens]
MEPQDDEDPNVLGPAPVHPGKETSQLKVPRIAPPQKSGWGRWFNDAKARKESAAVNANRDLDLEAREADHDRLEDLRKQLQVGIKVLFWVALICTCAGIIAWSLHQLIPAGWAWLNDSQLQTIQHILTTIAVSGLVGGLARRVMEPPSKSKRSDDD